MGIGLLNTQLHDTAYWDVQWLRENSFWAIMSSVILHHHFNPLLPSSSPHIGNNIKPCICHSKFFKSSRSYSISGVTTSVSTITPNPVANPIVISGSLHRVLIREREPERAFEILQQEVKQSSQSLPPSIYEFMIRRLGFGRRFQHMRRVFRLMKPPTEEAFIRMIESYAKHQMLDEALGLLKEIEVTQTPLTTKCYNVMFNLIVDMNKLSILGPLYSQMTSSGMKPNVETFNIMIKSLCNENKINSALTLLKQMSSDNGLVPNMDTYGTLVNGLVKNYGMDGALEIWKKWELNGLIPKQLELNGPITSTMIIFLCQMRRVGEKNKSGFSPDSGTLNKIANGFLKQGKLDEAAKLLEEMCATGLSPNIETFNSITSQFCKAKEAKKAAHFRERMAEMGFKPDVATHTNLILDMSKTGQMGPALGLLKQMTSDHNLTVSEETYTSLIQSLIKQNKVTEAWKLLKEMNRNGHVPRNIDYNSVLHWCCKNDRMDMASRYLEKMSEVGFCPDGRTFNILINGFCRKGRMSEATRLLEEMSRSGFQPTTVSINTIINGFCRARETGKAVDLFEKMVNVGFKPNTVTYNILILGLCHIGKCKEARRLLGQMTLGNYFAADVTTYNILIHAVLKQGEMDEAIDLLEELIRSGIGPNDVTRRTFFHSLFKNFSFADSTILIDKMREKKFISVNIAYDLLKKVVSRKGTTNLASQGSNEISTLLEKSVIS